MATRGILLSNLGSPDSPSVADVRSYLDEFLMDEYVLDMPFLRRRFVVSAFILPKRPRMSAAAYKLIWTDEGSPLVAITRKLRDLVQERLDDPVEIAMRYKNPSMTEGLTRLIERAGSELREILFVPLYPHHAMSTVDTAVAAARQALDTLDPSIRLDVLPPFYDNPEYIGALAATIGRHLESDFDHLLFSYHGLPERHLRKTDPTGQHCLQREDCCGLPSAAFKTCYRAQVFRTTEAVVERAKIPATKYSISFQSRLGRDTWLRPFTDMEIVRIAREGKKKMLVVCPAFVSDCLETLEEIGIRAREAFIESGGEDLVLVPCLNTDARWVEVLSSWCQAGSLTAVERIHE